MTNFASEYINRLTKLLEQIETDLAGPIDLAADAVANSFEAGGILHAFGTGHSHVIALELFYRAGGFANINPILIPELMLHKSASASSQIEREHLDVNEVFDSQKIDADDVLLLISNSGGNQATIDMAKAARARKVPVIVLTSLAHARSVESRSDTEKLHEFADFTLDNHGEPGDASVHVDGLAVAMGPTSTVANAAIVNALAIRVAQKLTERGCGLSIFTSANIVGGDAHNQELIKKFQQRVSAL